MANPNFTADYSTNQIWVGLDTTKCLTDTLEEMQSDIDGKAPNTHSHSHSDYANVDHTHKFNPVTSIVAGFFFVYI